MPLEDDIAALRRELAGPTARDNAEVRAEIVQQLKLRGVTIEGVEKAVRRTGKKAAE